ncbi:MAG TPA: tyrosine--tRNA ligase [Verrucomicrobia bacterium]|nr:tyrosine--tRNA ligase [Verrucomicrobiota bacterium]
MDNVVEVLRERGLLDAMSSPALEQAAGQRQLTVYAGFDPTSESLQVGNFVAIMGLSHFQRCGHHVVALVGGATGMIGDPSGKTSERTLLSEEQVRFNQEGIRENLSRFLDFNHPTAKATIVNNYDWFRDFSFIAFLREVGRHFRMGSMLGKDSVRSRLDSEAGMSFTEFSYQLLQAYDFLHLRDILQCNVQLGGSDQWGNITAGTDLIRKLRGEEAFGVTLPLVCDRTGQKFGKSAGNAIYLNSAKTSVYDFYQFFVRVDDADVIRFMKVFTFMPIEEIEDYASRMAVAPEKREAQIRLAEDVTRRVHGEDELKVAQRSTAVLFGESMDGLNATDLQAIFADVPSTGLVAAQVADQPLANVVADAGLCKSRGEARRLIQSGGLYLNNRRAEDPDQRVAVSDIVDGRLLVLRSGKKRYHLVRVG